MHSQEESLAKHQARKSGAYPGCQVAVALTQALFHLLASCECGGFWEAGWDLGRTLCVTPGSFPTHQEDRKEGMTAFVEKRKATFRDQ